MRGTLNTHVCELVRVQLQLDPVIEIIWDTRFSSAPSRPPCVWFRQGAVGTRPGISQGNHPAGVCDAPAARACRTRTAVTRRAGKFLLFSGASEAQHIAHALNSGWKFYDVDQYHVSLSRTLFLQHREIEPLVQRLSTALQGFQRSAVGCTSGQSQVGGGRSHRPRFCVGPFAVVRTLALAHLEVVILLPYSAFVRMFTGELRAVRNVCHR